jgi:hypothetical protein
MWRTFGGATIISDRRRCEIYPGAKRMIEEICLAIQALDIEPDDMEPGVIAAVIAAEGIGTKWDTNRLDRVARGSDLKPKWSGFVLNVHGEILNHYRKVARAAGVLGR